MDARFKEVCQKVALDKAKWSNFCAASRMDDVKQHQRAVFHAEAQRSTGQVVVDRYMDKFCKFFGSKDPDQAVQLYQFFQTSLTSVLHIAPPDLHTVVIVDFTKFGAVNQETIDWLIGVTARMVTNVNSVALVLAPILDNPSVENGESGERARIEKKMRAKDLWPVLITLIACAAQLCVLITLIACVRALPSFVCVMQTSLTS